MKVLIVEDDPVSRRLLEALLLKWGYDVTTSCDGGEALEELRKPSAPSLVISDWMMPSMEGIELCRKIRKTEGPSYVYFIILTTKGRKEDVVKGLEAGADDYLIKPFDEDELKCRIRIGERIIELERRIMQLASTDPLTGVLNRRVFMERVEVEIQRSLRDNARLSLLLADIDHFKEINDTFGHQVGDIVLQKFAEALTQAVRAHDFVGRYGGEEFFICLAGQDVIQARSVGERIRKSVQGMKIVAPGTSEPIQITASFGVASFKPGSEESVDSLSKRADEAMYEAKHKGRNRVCCGRALRKQVFILDKSAIRLSRRRMGHNQRKVAR